MQDNSLIKGFVSYRLIDELGQVKQEGLNHNLVVTEGDNWVASKIYGTASPMIQMVLGTSITAPQKADTWVNGPFANNGAAAGTAGSVSVGTLSGTANGIQYIGTFGAGYATQNGIQEAVISDTAPGTAGTEPTGGKILAHALLSPGTINKGANDVLIVTWNITFTGA